jgi:hypothetical protein
MKLRGTEIGLDEPVTDMVYIGSYLGGRFREHDIVTCDDLLWKLFLLGEELSAQGMNDLEIRYEVKGWLREVLRNARPRQCLEDGKEVLGSFRM